MNVKTKALLFNLICFGLLFVLVKTIIGTLIPMSYIPLIAFSALIASVFSPKFLVEKGKLYIKIPLVKEPWEL
jgi:predicted permease